MISAMVKKINADRIIMLYLILAIIAVCAILGFWGYLTLFILPKIITKEINTAPMNNDTYSILLQALIIVGGVILGLISSISIETLKKLGTISLSRFWKSILLFILLYIFMISAILIILSIAFSINGILDYGVVNTYITTQINTGIIHTEIGGNVILINGTYFGESNVTSGIKIYYNNLVSDTKIAINTLFAGFISWIGFIVAYAIILFYTDIMVRKGQKPNPPPPPPSRPI